MNLNLNAGFKDTHIGNKGFTLVELLIVVGIMAIVLAIAVPDFVTSTRKLQTKHQAKEMAAAIKLAQSEAIRLRQRVSMCRSNSSQTSCNLSTPHGDWSDGWIIWIDLNSGGGVNPNEPVLAVQPAVNKGYKKIASGNIAPRIVFNADGSAPSYIGNIEFYYYDTSNPSNKIALTTLIINSAGRLRIQ
jgi:type IV fimbrial biogenesis protein FimT